MSGGDNFFVDTNVLLYWLDAAEPRKQELAAAWLRCLWQLGAGRTSWQVMQEFYANAVGKLKAPSRRARREVEDLAEWRPLGPNLFVLRRAWHWCDEARINFWDAMIVAAAEQSDCRWLLSEDFQAGRKFDSVTVVNPFEREPAEFGLA